VTPRARNRTKVLVRERIADAGVELLRDRFDVDVDLDGDLAEKIGEYDAIIVRSGTQLTSDLIDRADRLKVIGRAGVGVDNVDLRLPLAGESSLQTRRNRR
jgi:D-3-phosphoglycerate dehydrogenase